MKTWRHFGRPIVSRTTGIKPSPATFEVTPEARRRYLVAVDREVLARVQRLAHMRGVSSRRPQNPKTVETLTHDEARRKNIPDRRVQSVMQKEEQSPDPRGLRAPQPRPRPAARLARQGRAGLVRPRRPRAAALHPGEGPPQGADRRPAARRRASSASTTGGAQPTCSPTSTASPDGRATRPSSTSTTRTGRTA